MKTKEKFYTELTRFCAYRERCSREVEHKMDDMDVPENFREDLLNQLKKERYLDDLRYAEQYVKGKFNQKRWGRIKISYGLFQKGIPKAIIDQALKQIDEEDYINTLNYLIDKQRPKIKAKNDFERSQKLKRFLQNKGYEMDYLWEI